MPANRIAGLLLGVALLVAVFSTGLTHSTRIASSLTDSPLAGATAPARSATGPSALKPINPAALQTNADTTAKELLVPGAVVLLRTPQGEFRIRYGTTLLGTTSPPRADTYFRIASNTKTMTAAVILQLAQEGKLSLGDSVSKYVRGVPNGDNITIAELLEIRSGLYNLRNGVASRWSGYTDPCQS
jgi:D-alanyl-D-alanine carboxypeptidase